MVARLTPDPNVACLNHVVVMWIRMKKQQCNLVWFQSRH